MRTLSVFVDESGDFGEPRFLPANYLVSFVFHDQAQDIAAPVAMLERSIRDAGFQIEYIHTGPVLRKEGIFNAYSLDERRQLLYKMLNFFNHCDISHYTVSVDRREARDKVTLSGKLAKEVKTFLDLHASFFNSFDKIIIYYDHGQIELSSILNAVFSVYFSNVEFRRAEPQNYRLLQVADFVCSMELLRIKWRENRLSSSEQKFFYKPQELKKAFQKSIDRKKMS